MVASDNPSRLEIIQFSSWRKSLLFSSGSDAPAAVEAGSVSQYGQMHDYLSRNY